MSRYYKFLCFFILGLSPFFVQAQSDTIAYWSFENGGAQQLISPPLTIYGPYSPEQGSGALTSQHLGGAFPITFANVGNGTPKSLNISRWTTIGDYIQFQVNTLGKSNIQLSFEQGSASGNGPKDFKVSYSTDGTNFTDLPGGAFEQSYSLTGTQVGAWSASSYMTGFHKSFTMPAALNNTATAFIRLSTTTLQSVSVGTNVSPQGNSRFDDVVITGTTIAPTTLITNVATNDSSFCNAGNNQVSVSFNTNATSTTTYTVERSDASGSFTTPVVIGSGTASPIIATIPLGLPAGANYRIRVVAPGSTSQNTAGPISIDQAISITLQPSDVTICEGGIVNFAMQSPNAQTYYWLYNGNPVTNNSWVNTYGLPAATTAQAGNYSVALSNGACADTSNNAVVIVTPGTMPTNASLSGTRFFGTQDNYPVIGNNGSCGRLARIKSLNNALGSTMVTVNAFAPQQAGTSGPWYLGRYYSINPTTAPNSNVGISLYFSQQDLDAYNLAAPAAQQIIVNQSAQTLGNFYLSKLTNVNDLGTANAVLVTPDSVRYQNGYWTVSFTSNSFSSLHTFYAHGSNFAPCPTPTLSIAASINNICSGTSVNYTATTTNQGANPGYQWKVNGTNAGTGVLFNYTPANGDTITCTLTNTDCFTPTTANSNTITMQVTPTVTAGIIISASTTSSCEGSMVSYTAAITNGGTTPAYQWKVNGVNAGTNAASLDYTPDNGDTITCELTSNATCLSSSTPVISNTLTATVTAPVVAAVAVSANPSGNAAPGEPIVYTATVSGTSTYGLDWYVNDQLVLQQQNPDNTFTRPAAAIPDTIHAVLRVEGCFTDTAYRSNEVIVSTTNSLPEISKAMGLKFYPNPVLHSLSIEVNQGTLQEVQVVNLISQTVQTEATKTGTKQVLNFAHLTPGIYYVKIRVQYQSKEYIIVEKIVKK